MRFAFIARPDNTKALLLAVKLAEFVVKRGNSAVFEENMVKCMDADAFKKTGAEVMPFSKIDADIAIVTGGDGTVLHAVRELYNQIPIAGVNCGNVGFMTDIEPDEAEEYLIKIESGDYTVEERMRLLVRVDDEFRGEALNEAVIITSKSAKILNMIVNIGNIPAEKFRADGVIISTPTGSTGYSMSAGGPIVDPLSEGFIVVPVAPYYLMSRPHIVSTKRRLSVELDSAIPANLVIDGQFIMEIYNGNTVTFEKSDKPAYFVNIGRNFFSKVDSKLKNL